MPSISTNGSPSMIMRSEKVPESPSSALQTMYFCARRRASTVFHLMPAGKAAPPRPRRPESSTCCTICAPAPAPARGAGREAVVRHVVVERQRIGDADAREGQALLLLQVGDLFGRAEAQRMRAAVEEAGVEQAGDVLRRHRAVGDAARRRLHFDQRLEPEHAARAVAHQVARRRRAPRPLRRCARATRRRRPPAPRRRAARRR